MLKFPAVSAEARSLFLAILTGDRPAGTVPGIPASGSLSSAAVIAAHLGAGESDLAELDGLIATYGEDCPLAELLPWPPPYPLASRILPEGYTRAVIEATLDEIFAAGPRTRGAWLAARSPDAGGLLDVRIRILGYAGDTLRLEVTGDPREDPPGQVENPLVPDEEVALGLGCEQPDGPGYCGSTAGGFMRLCPRCLAIHYAQAELLSHY